MPSNVTPVNPVNPVATLSLLQPTVQAQAYCGCSNTTFKKYVKQLSLLPEIAADGRKYWRKVDLDNLRERLVANRKAGAGGRPPKPLKLAAGRDVQSFNSNLLKAATTSMLSTNGQKQLATVDLPEDEDSDDLEGSPTPPSHTQDLNLYSPVVGQQGALKSLTVKEISQIVRDKTISLLDKYQALEIVAADLLNPSWKARQNAAVILLSLVVPKLKSIEVVHTGDEEGKLQRERAIKVWDEMKAAGLISRPRPVQASIEGILEVEADN